MRARATGTPAATQRSQNPDTISTSEVPARPACVSHADNSVKTASFMPRLYSHAVWFWHQADFAALCADVRFRLEGRGWFYRALAVREAPCFGPSTTTNEPIFTRL